MANRRPAAVKIFAGLCMASAIAIAAAIHWAGLRGDRAAAASLGSTLFVQEGVRTPARIYFRSNELGPHFGHLGAVVYGGESATTSFVDHLACEAVYVAAGNGICLSANRGVVTTYSAKIFDTATYTVRAELPLPGIPSRTRVSSDGTVGATTVFVTGHGYDSVDFSTQTLLIDLQRNEVVADLETFAVTENGRSIVNPDFNFWGVTFAPDNMHFYATLSTGGRHVLVKGSIADRTIEVMRENVECPSLSPDGTRVAYKRRIIEEGRIRWQLHVLDLATREDTPIAEWRSVDDQLEWLDHDHVLYSVVAGTTASAATDIWMSAADGSGEPSLYLPNAYSPSVVSR